MLKSIFKYSVLAALFKEYRSKLYLLLSLVLVYFLIDHIYTDVQQYLSDVHPEYLIFALWVKSIGLIILAIALLITFKPSTKRVAKTNGDIELSQNDQQIIEKISSKSTLSSNEAAHEGQKEPVHTESSNEEIINNIKKKDILETEADKIINELGKGR